MSYDAFVIGFLSDRRPASFDQPSGPLVIIRRVDVDEQQSLGIDRRQLAAPDFHAPHASGRDRSMTFAAHYSLVQGRRACAPLDRAERLVIRFVRWHDRVRPPAGSARHPQPSCSCRCSEPLVNIIRWGGRANE